MSIILPVKWDRTRALTLEHVRGWRAISYLRFSATLQEDGDSIERQRINTQRAVTELGLLLDGSLEDRAKSASKGHHRLKGELGRFLAAIEAGHIPAGTVLIVEAVDRLTREGTLDVYPMLQVIIRAGIVLLVCGEAEDCDEFELYDEHAINGRQGDRLHSDIRAAYKYTKRLSQNAKAKHARRRAQANEGILVIPNGVPPFWINREIGARRRGEPVHTLNSHARAVQRMFEEALADRSVRQITDTLLKEGILNPNGDAWRAPAVGRILRDDAVLGYWTPIQWENGRRAPVDRGHIVYPEAISPALWQAVQDRLDSRAKVLRGATGKTVPNLFSGHSFCPSCGAGMRIDTGGGLRRGARKRHLICGAYVDHRGCTDASRYDMNLLERPILLALAERLRLVPAQPVASFSAERRGSLELAIRQTDEAIAAVMPRAASSPTLLAHVERLAQTADAMRAELVAVIEAMVMEQKRQSQADETWRMIRTTLAPTLRGEPEARERMRLLLASQNYRVVGDGGGRVVVHVGAEEVPVPAYPGMVDYDAEESFTTGAESSSHPPCGAARASATLASGEATPATPDQDHDAQPQASEPAHATTRCAGDPGEALPPPAGGRGAPRGGGGAPLQGARRDGDLPLRQQLGAGSGVGRAARARGGGVAACSHS